MYVDQKAFVYNNWPKFSYYMVFTCRSWPATLRQKQKMLKKVILFYYTL